MLLFRGSQLSLVRVWKNLEPFSGDSSEVTQGGEVGGRGAWPQDLGLLNHGAWKAVGVQPGTSDVGPTPGEMLRPSLVEPFFQRNLIPRLFFQRDFIPHCLLSAPQTPRPRKPRESHLKKNLAPGAPSPLAGGSVPRFQSQPPPPPQQTPNHRNARGHLGTEGGCLDRE